ncbi:MYLK protein, partial [Polypterus senegalus]
MLRKIFVSITCRLEKIKINAKEAIEIIADSWTQVKESTIATNTESHYNKIFIATKYFLGPWQFIVTEFTLISEKPNSNIVNTETFKLKYAASNGISKEEKESNTQHKAEPKEVTNKDFKIVVDSKRETVQTLEIRKPSFQSKPQIDKLDVQQELPVNSTFQNVQVLQTPKIYSNPIPDKTTVEPLKIVPSVVVESKRSPKANSPEVNETGKLRETRKYFGEHNVEPAGIPPRFDIPPQSQETLEGQEVIFKIKVLGSPKPEITWMRDGYMLKEKTGIKIYEEGGIHYLCLQNVLKEDSGCYICKATNSRGQISGSCTLNVTDKTILYAHTTYENQIARLNVQDALPEDDGMYSCVAENSFGRAVCSAKVAIKEKEATKCTKSSEEENVNKEFAPVFVKGLNDLQVMDGSQVRMTVEVRGNPKPELVWLQNGKEIQESEDFHFVNDGNEYSLCIQEVFPEDTGKYMCEAWNELGECRTEATLTVQEPQDGVQPWFISKPKSVTAELGQRTLLSCAIAGDPFPDFKWFKDGEEVVPGEGFDIVRNEDVITLLIRKVKTYHAGEYEVKLKNSVGGCSCLVSLIVQESLLSSEETHQTLTGTNAHPFGRKEEGTYEIKAFNETEILRKNSQVEVSKDEDQADVRGLLKRRVETKEHSEDRIRSQEAQQIDFRTVLGKKVVTKSVSEEDLKELSAEQMDFRANLQRQVKPKTLSEEERKIHSPQQVDFRAVLANKKTNPKVSDAEKSQSKNASQDFRSVLVSKKKMPTENNKNNGSTGVEVENIQPKNKQNEVNCDHGCTVVDGGIIGQKKNNIGKEPTFTEKLHDIHVLDGDHLYLQCQVSADPPPIVSWSLDGKLIKPSKFIILTQEGTVCSLSIDKALPEDEGEYKFKAENSLGKTECSCMVYIDDPSEAKSPKSTDKRTKKPRSTPSTPTTATIPPQILQFPEDMKIRAGEPVELFCKFAGTQPITSKWLKFRKQIEEKGSISIECTETSSKLTIAPTKHEHCGCYTLQLENKHGSRQAQVNLTIVDKPEPPAGVPCASDVRSDTLTLSWYGPTYDGGSAVQSYTVEIWNSVEKQWKDLTTCRSTSYNIQNLLPDRDYRFRVRAQNIYGVSEPSQESDLVKVGETQVDSDKESDPLYRDVEINKSQKVSEFYNIEERLGTGKFGQVFKLVEKKTGKSWAGKFIKAFSAKDKENVRQEIGIMNCLHHPKLVQCVDAFEGKSDIVMVMEIISGGELFERIIDEDFELTEREVIKYMLQIVDGVQFIHQQGIVHLDLKPENIMCVNKTGSKIKLIDFGLARRLESASDLKVLFGTPEFVAPEVINYEPIGYATDMWSIGVICYILVSGLSPFMGDNDNETLANVTSATWDFDDEAFDEISDDAKNFISSLLKKDMKAIGRLSSMAMISGLSAKKGNSPTSPTVSEKHEMADDATKHLLEALDEESAHVKPYFTKVIKDVEVIEGSAARFDCKIEGYPDPEVVWFKDNQPIKETRHFQIDYDEEGNCSLVISDVCVDDDAKYTCKAVNSLGEVTCTAELIVETMGQEEEEEE